MEVLIKYRNERKKEGASMAELNGLDGRINACMSNAGQEKTAFDIELLNYRAQIASASPVNKDLLARVDTHIFHQLGSTPAKVIVVKVRTISMGPNEGIPVAIDINNETIGDLGQKAAAVIGMTGNYKVIFNGRHHDDLLRPLSTTNITEDTVVAICKRLGCDGNCCDRSYSLLADALYRDANKLFKDVRPEAIHELFVVFSELRNKRPKLDSSAAVECRVLPEAFRPRDDDGNWTALLSAARNRTPFKPWSAEASRPANLLAEWRDACEAQPLRQSGLLVCEALGGSKGDAKASALCKLLSESTTASGVPTLNATPTNNISVEPTRSALPESDDEDLYG